MTHFNNLTPAEAERLAMLAEECAEVIQVVGKILRHGYNSRHPSGGLNNRGLLREEVRDLVAVLSALDDAEDLDLPSAYQSREIWKKKLRYTHHQREDQSHD